MPMRPPGGWQSGETVANRYRVQAEVGVGNFARVLSAKDLESGREVALKVLKPEYARDAQFELEILQHIVRRDPKQRHGVCWMLEHLQWQSCPCFVFKLHGTTLKSRQFGDKHVSAADISRFARRIGGALRFMHFECLMVHTDLKPENILITSPDDTAGIGRDWTVCDLGSASFFGTTSDHDLISTRPYRAPEVVGKIPWSYAADVWSFGCILYELARGRKLFDAMDDSTHMREMQGRIGPAPKWFSESAQAQKRSELFDGSGRLRHGPRVGEYRHLRDDFADDPAFADLMLQCLLYDPAGRLRADEILHHPFSRMHAPASERPPPLITRLPASGYTSGHNKSPCCTLSAGCEPVPIEERERLCEVSLMRLGGRVQRVDEAGRSRAEEHLRMARDEHTARRRGQASR